jgi:hypothetical protein
MAQEPRFGVFVLLEGDHPLLVEPVQLGEFVGDELLWPDREPSSSSCPAPPAAAA